ncbi:MAG TPA: ATP-binding cassette domain-containing protein, partial [Candidatus Anoxymicrobiaceae bacterium]
MSDVIVKVDDLVKNFGNLVAVNHVSFDVNRGEIFGFLGPNGAGKTTTINMLCTLLKPTAGTAVVNKFDIITQRNEVRESIGLVFQDPSLDDRLTARENLEFHAVVYHVPRSVREERIKEVLDMVSLWDRAEDRVETYSGGMKRRLEIARGLLHYPKVLFLDEPTIGLDPQTRNYIWEYIEGLKKREGITIFLTTHYMEEAEHCDRIAVIDLGEIIA